MNCPFCNQTLPDGAAFCGFCGNKLTDIAQAAEAENVEQDIESAVSTITDAAAAPETASTTAVETATATAVETTENIIPDMPDTVQNVSPVNLGKNESASASGETPVAENNFANQVRDGFQNVASSVQNDTQEAVAAVKSGNFKELLKNKTFLICCGAVIAVILLVVIIIICTAAAGSAHKRKGAYYRAEDSGDAVYFYNGTIVKGADLSSESYFLATSLDGSAAVVKDDEELYLFKGAKATSITDDFDTSSASISANGKVVSYVSDDTVYIYSGGKNKKIAELEDASRCEPVISPNGKTVAFADKDDDDIMTYVWKGGSKAIDLDSDIIPISVSNGGKMIYGKDESGDLFFINSLKKGGEEKIDSYDEIVGISFDHTKLLYVSEGSTYCFDTSIDKEEGVRITKDVIEPIADFIYDGSIPYIDDFKKFYGEEDGNLYKYFRKGKAYDDDKIISDANGLSVSEDGKSILYIDDNDLMKGTLSNAKNAKKIGKDVYSYSGNDSFSNVFYLDEDSTLRYGGKDGKIASHVEDFIVTNGGVCVFYDSDGDLYYSSKGGEKKKVGLDEISSLAIRNNVVYVVSDGDLYISTNGKSFKKTNVEVG